MEEKTVSAVGPAAGKADEYGSPGVAGEPKDAVVIETGTNGKELDDKDKKKQEEEEGGGAGDYFV